MTAHAFRAVDRPIGVRVYAEAADARIGHLRTKNTHQEIDHRRSGRPIHNRDRGQTHRHHQTRRRRAPQLAGRATRRPPRRPDDHPHRPTRLPPPRRHRHRPPRTPRALNHPAPPSAQPEPRSCTGERHPQRRKEPDKRVLYKGTLPLLALRDLTEVGRFTPRAELGPRRLWLHPHGGSGASSQVTSCCLVSGPGRAAPPPSSAPRARGRRR